MPLTNRVYERLECLFSVLNKDGNMEDFVKHTQITEAKNEKIKSLEIIKNISKDLEILNKDVELIKQEAEKSNDYLTSTLMDNYIEDYSKRIWMLNETIK